MSDAEIVTTMLNAAGLDIPPDEVAELLAGYATLKIGITSLYAPEFADADPYLVPGFPMQLGIS